MHPNTVFYFLIWMSIIMTYILATLRVVTVIIYQHLMLYTSIPLSTNGKCTFNNPTAQSRNALYLRHIVLEEVVITLRAAHVPRQAEPLPQLAGHRHVVLCHRFSTHIEAISHQSPVSQHADPTARTGTQIQGLLWSWSFSPNLHYSQKVIKL